MAVKVTFTLDDVTVALLARTADRLSKPKSQVVREAIRDYSARIDKLSEEERRRQLAVFDDLVSRIRPRAEENVRKELEAVRQARRRGGRAGA